MIKIRYGSILKIMSAYGNDMDRYWVLTIYIVVREMNQIKTL